jgi:hypothetical protein
MHSMIYWIRWTSLIVMALGLLIGCSASKPTVIITSPPSGSQFSEGDEVKVQSTATDSAGIDRVELLVDGVVVRSDQSPSPQVSFTLVQAWKSNAGSHIVSVRAYNKSGGASEPAAITLAVVQASAAPSPATTPTTVAVIPPGGSPPPLPPGVTPSATATGVPGPGNCANNSLYLADVTIPDGTTIAAGQVFNKTWRFSNNGSCSWNGFEFVFVSGEAMTGTTVVPAPIVAAGGTADITVPMTAPSVPGKHQGRWQFRTNTGTLFGQVVSVVINVPGAPAPTSTTSPTNTPTPPAISCSGTPVIASFGATSTSINVGTSTTLQWGAVTNADSVEIDQGIGGIPSPGTQVVSPTLQTMYTMTAHCGASLATKQVTITVLSVLPPPVMLVYDLVDKANLASWSGSAGSLAFPGIDTDTRGFALWRTSAKLNDGSTPSRVLETHPQWVANGTIQGTFTDVYTSGYVVQSSDKITGKVGFLNGAASGNVTFKIMIRPQSGTNTWIVNVPVTYADGVKSFSQSLSAYTGKRADFIILVDAGSSAGQDWAVWQDLRIIRGGP